MSDTAETFDKACRAIFGFPYENDAARFLEVRNDTVRHWSTGRRAIPPYVWPRLFDLATDKEAEIVSTIKALAEQDGAI